MWSSSRQAANRNVLQAHRFEAAQPGDEVIRRERAPVLIVDSAIAPRLNQMNQLPRARRLRALEPQSRMARAGAIAIPVIS